MNDKNILVLYLNAFSFKAETYYEVEKRKILKLFLIYMLLNAIVFLFGELSILITSKTNEGMPIDFIGRLGAYALNFLDRITTGVITVLVFYFLAYLMKIHIKIATIIKNFIFINTSYFFM